MGLKIKKDKPPNILGSGFNVMASGIAYSINGIRSKLTI